MNAYQIVGGEVSPSGIVVAKNKTEALALYNRWLTEAEERTDKGVGVYPLVRGTVIIHNRAAEGFHAIRADIVLNPEK